MFKTILEYTSKGFIYVLMFLLVFLVILALQGWVVMLLWNFVVSPVFGIVEISFLQGCGLVMLVNAVLWIIGMK